MIFFCPSRGRARKIGFYALFSKIICFRLKIGVSYQLLKERGSKLAQIFACGIKIDAILITSSLIPSRLSHLARVIFKKIYFLYLFPVGEVIYQGVFQNFSNPLPQLSDPKNEALSESFSKKCSHPSTARF